MENFTADVEKVPHVEKVLRFFINFFPKEILALSSKQDIFGVREKNATNFDHKVLITIRKCLALQIWI